MKKSTKLLSTVGALLLASTTMYAQFTLSGEFRPRTEYRQGYKALSDSGQSNALYTDQRTRLNLDYKAETFQTFLSLQDIRTWGSQSQLNSTDGLMSVHQAWGKVKFNKKFALKFGRQEMVYDDHRIFGSVGWAQQARSHDAGIFTYKDSTLSIHFGGAFNQDSPQMVTTSYTVPKSYKAMQFFWLNKDFGKVKMSLLFLNNGQQVNTTDKDGNPTFHDNYTQIVGTRTVYKGGKFGLAFNGYYQMGKTAQAPARDVSAYLLGLDLSYKVSKAVSFTLGYELQSGNSQTDTTAAYAETQHAFSPYYGTNHKFNGFMDYFYVGNHGGNVGLQDIYLKSKFKVKKVTFGLHGHVFLTAADVLNAQNTTEISAMNSTLGTEIDASAAFKLAKGVTCKAGYSQMFGTRTLAAIKGNTDYLGNPTVFGTSNWAYLMIIVKPTFLSTAK